MVPDVDEATTDLNARFDSLLHTDDASRLDVWKGVSSGPSYLRRLTMLEFQLNHRGVLRDPAKGAGWLFDRAPIRDELVQLADVLKERIGIAEERYPVSECHSRFIDTTGDARSSRRWASCSPARRA